jgi:multicomponent K+:H+ antiporter subunit E
VKRWLPRPLMWLSMTVLWLLLNQSLWIGHILLGGALAWVASRLYGRLEGPRSPRSRASSAWRRLAVACALLLDVLQDVVRSNVAVARIVLFRPRHSTTAGFLDIPLELRDPAGLAVLACIITATPGTAWAGYAPDRAVLTLHILDLIDESAWIDVIKGRYERRLKELFE